MRSINEKVESNFILFFFIWKGACVAHHDLCGKVPEGIVLGCVSLPIELSFKERLPQTLHAATHTSKMHTSSQLRL